MRIAYYMRYDAKSPRHQAFHPCGPIDRHVENRFFCLRQQMKQTSRLAALDLLDQNPAIAEANDAKPVDQVARHRAPDVVIIDQPAVEKRTEAVAANFDRDGGIGGVFGGRNIVEMSAILRKEV